MLTVTTTKNERTRLPAIFPSLGGPNYQLRDTSKEFAFIAIPHKHLSGLTDFSITSKMYTKTMSSALTGCATLLVHPLTQQRSMKRSFLVTGNPNYQISFCERLNHTARYNEHALSFHFFKDCIPLAALYQNFVFDGGTGASSILPAGGPWALVLTKTYQVLVKIGLWGRAVPIVYDFPAGFANQREELCARFLQVPDDCVNVFLYVAMEVCILIAAMYQNVGFDGGTGASPISSIKHAGGPCELGLAKPHQILIEYEFWERAALLVYGVDVLTAATIGADKHRFHSVSVMCTGWLMAHVCHRNDCSVSFASQREELYACFLGCLVLLPTSCMLPRRKHLIAGRGLVYQIESGAGIRA